MLPLLSGVLGSNSNLGKKTLPSLETPHESCEQAINNRENLNSTKPANSESWLTGRPSIDKSVTIGPRSIKRARFWHASSSTICSPVESLDNWIILQLAWLVAIASNVTSATLTSQRLLWHDPECLHLVEVEISPHTLPGLGHAARCKSLDLFLLEQKMNDVQCPFVNFRHFSSPSN